jgi:hypothetical protein
VALLADARSLAVVNVIVQANFVLAFPYPFFGDGVVARAWLIEFFTEVEQGVQGRNMAKGAKIGSAPFVSLSCFEDARKVFVSDGNGRVGLVVFEQYVIMGLVLFDEVVFQQECVLLCFDNDIADVEYLFYQ